MKSKTVVLAVFLAALQLPAARAQSENEQQPPPADPCETLPEAERDAQGNSQPGTDQELAEKLDRCNGVLKPPPTADQEIEEPPPDTGTTPVIPPSELPPDQPPKP